MKAFFVEISRTCTSYFYHDYSHAFIEKNAEMAYNFFPYYPFYRGKLLLYVNRLTKIVMIKKFYTYFWIQSWEWGTLIWINFGSIEFNHNNVSKKWCKIFKLWSIFNLSNVQFWPNIEVKNFLVDVPNESKFTF